MNQIIEELERLCSLDMMLDSIQSEELKKVIRAYINFRSADINNAIKSSELNKKTCMGENDIARCINGINIDR